jgi:TetR/AcrR family transcriptional regulator, transcriptional repressor for nem operon
MVANLDDEHHPHSVQDDGHNLRCQAMGHSKANKQRSRELIVKTAAKVFRERGVDGIGLADLMKAAGLTHGGFYGHFDSRDDLIAEAVERALGESGKSMASIVEGGLPRKMALVRLIDAYLSVAHRDQLGTSCAVAIMANDVSRSNARCRSAYTRQVEIYLDLLVGLIATEKRKSRKSKAIAALSTLVGAVSMARAVNDEKLSRELLRVAADELKRQLAI